MALAAETGRTPEPTPTLELVVSPPDILNEALKVDVGTRVSTLRLSRELFGRLGTDHVVVELTNGETLAGRCKGVRNPRPTVPSFEWVGGLLQLEVAEKEIVPVHLGNIAGLSAAPKATN
jgi:hypothetical protein